MYFSRTISSWVRVPVLSVQNTSISPKVWIELRRLTMVCLRDILTAPLAREDVMMTGSISGMMPTAIVMPNIRDCSQLPLVMKLAIKMMGTITAMKLISRRLMEFRFSSKLLFSLNVFRLLAILPK